MAPAPRFDGVYNGLVLEKQTVFELRIMLKGLGLPVSGLKADLIARFKGVRDPARPWRYAEPLDGDQASKQDEGDGNPLPEHNKDETSPSIVDTVATMDPSSDSSTAVEAMQDTQKRKRSSLSPVSDDDDVAHKRSRQADTEPVTKEAERDSFEVPDDGMEDVSPGPEYKTHTEIERDVGPSLHPATSGLYIKNLMRPLRPELVQEHLLNLATPVADSNETPAIVDFYIDPIRTHAFVVFNIISAAARVRSILHNSIWPDETNRKALWVDFFPPERFADWVVTEKSSSGGRGSTIRYEIMYENDNDGSVTAKLVEFDTTSTKQQAMMAQESQVERKPSIPTGPSRQYPGIEGAPTGPRSQQARGPAMNPNVMGRLSQPGISTRAYPSITYQPVVGDLVKERLDAISAAKTKSPARDFGKEYNRYYFEDGGTLVDRGPEIFLGIRPPHRERERQRERQNGEPYRSHRAPRGHRRRNDMPIFHGVPRGGDRFRPGDYDSSRAVGRSRYADDRASYRDRSSRHRDDDDRARYRDGYSRRRDDADRGSYHDGYSRHRDDVDRGSYRDRRSRRKDDRSGRRDSGSRY
ncbi:hypothetical protein GGR54DRAFT_602505 [Hypoxylon sp. NC1633]|nr:hypothetical protein GGR54DRAFT_602505 [Hypoxylon sp. NC1633]